MPTVKERDANLTALLDRAVSGEVVVVERDDRSKVQFMRVDEPPADLSEDEWIEWWAARAVPVAADADDSVTIIRRLRGYGD